MNARVRHAAQAIVFGLALLCTHAARAYALYPYEGADGTLYLKWGDPHAGKDGGEVTWSLMPAGTPGAAAYCGDACPGNSVAAIEVEVAPGAGFAPVPLETLVDRVERTLARWSRATGIRFRRVADSGVAINDPSAQPPATGDIRIGIFAFASGGGAIGYAPPPNGGSAAGDVLLDANSFYQFAPGGEGDAYDTTFAPNDVESLLLHELGHAVGLAHPAVDGSCPVMQVAPACQGHVNRLLDADDLAGARFLYDSLFADGFEE